VNVVGIRWTFFTIPYPLAQRVRAAVFSVTDRSDEKL